MNRKKDNKRNTRKQGQTLVSIPRGPKIPSQIRRQERLVLRTSGAAFTAATTTGYSWLTVDSTLFNAASPWTSLSNLYMYVRPIACKITVTSARSTSTSDNPVVGFAATPDGNMVGSTAMSISTFEAANCISQSLPPGVGVSYYFDAYIALAAYATPTNGYVPFRAPRVSLNSLPRVYFGDILMSTPGLLLPSNANYIQVKIEFVMEFDTLDNANIQ